MIKRKHFSLIRRLVLIIKIHLIERRVLGYKLAPWQVNYITHKSNIIPDHYYPTKSRVIACELRLILNDFEINGERSISHSYMNVFAGLGGHSYYRHFKKLYSKIVRSGIKVKPIKFI